MEGEIVANLVLTRPQLIKMTGSKALVDAATRAGSLPHIKVGKENSKRPRHLYLRRDVERWLEGLAVGGRQE